MIEEGWQRERYKNLKFAIKTTDPIKQYYKITTILYNINTRVGVSKYCCKL
jgi:hypothetical protein